MKRFTALLLVFILTFCLFGCSQEENNPGPAVQNDVTSEPAKEVTQSNEEVASLESEETVAETETVATDADVYGELLLTVSKLTFSVVEETEDIYCGSLPRDVIIWESSDESKPKQQQYLEYLKTYCFVLFRI